ncbi:putative HAD superfamily Cof-like phosphohydrolase [Anaerobacterium chartisolvens]|uniref:Putative HAD superfamily Cof-like phosphohydrolase n=1 Tax=Anaerobacterium chartisolvens TaxID=1297424 RepID=A0A369AVF7_9FIRM|nr:HAD family hydrolase [Anaerobacterium chartisolvens]RCX12328.1 putative HAD superfamily Cof-like phosphohydrolase [Anaerobacterium chartisolvens]
MSLDDTWIKVREFHEKFGHPVSEKPVLLNEDRVGKRYDWMLEEINEFKESDNIYDQADAMIDLIYFAVGTMVEMGVKPENVFDIVHSANMRKLWPDGKPHYNEQGKTIKPAGWTDPYNDIKKEIDFQSKKIT